MEANTAKTQQSVFQHINNQLGHIWLLVHHNLTSLHERDWWARATYVNMYLISLITSNEEVIWQLAFLCVYLLAI